MDNVNNIYDKQSIYRYIDIRGIRKYLVNYPNLLLMFEVLSNHIDDYVQLRILIEKRSMGRPCRI